MSYFSVGFGVSNVVYFTTNTDVENGRKKIKHVKRLEIICPVVYEVLMKWQLSNLYLAPYLPGVNMNEWRGNIYEQCSLTKGQR